MGFGISKQVTINQRTSARPRTTVLVFSKADAGLVLQAEGPGTYLLYRDHDSDRLYLSVRCRDHVEHHRVNFEDNLYYMDNQPYPYLDSIVLYHQRHKLKGIKLTHPAQLSARTVKNFTTRITARNGNVESDTWSVNSDALSEDERLPRVEHTNDMVLSHNKISKSSGRLWRSGIDRSLKRMSAPEMLNDHSDRYTYHVTNTFGNGHVPISLFESNTESGVGNSNKHLSRNSTPLADVKDISIKLSPESEPWPAYRAIGQDRGGSNVREEKSTSKVLKEDSKEPKRKEEPVILYCSHL